MTDYDQIHAYRYLNALHKEIMCNADDTPIVEWWYHKHPFGHLQNRQCRQWGPIRDFATKHIACFDTSGQYELGRPSFDQCDGGDNGIIIH